MSEEKEKEEQVKEKGEKTEEDVVTESDKKTESDTESETEEKSEPEIADVYIHPAVEEHKRKKKTGKKIGIGILAFLLLVYFGGVIFHLNCFGTMTTINGIDVSGKSVKSAEKLLLADGGQYVLQITFKDCTYEIAVGDAGSTVGLTETLSSVLKKNSPFLWIADSFRNYDYEVAYTISCDRDALINYMADCPALNEASMKEPQDAKVVMQDGEAVIVPDETGTRLDTDKLYDKIINALKNYETSLDADETECYVQAHVLADSESILQAKQNAEDFLSIEACYDFGDYQYVIPKEELTKMAYVSEDGTIKISKNNVISFAEDLKDKFSTADTDREFVTHDGKTIQIHGTYYGWVLDAETEAEELYALLCEKKSFTKEPACERRGYAMTEDNDIGDTYVEVDLTNQHVYFYQNGSLKWDSDCVSGQTPAHKTPGGLYGITYKARNATLRGEDYETPVSYWMPFNKGIGLHDATWRSKFGDDIYTYSGSHGCVNLPLEKAAELFEYVETGMPVICYWRDEVLP